MLIFPRFSVYTWERGAFPFSIGGPPPKDDDDKGRGEGILLPSHRRPLRHQHHHHHHHQDLPADVKARSADITTKILSALGHAVTIHKNIVTAVRQLHADCEAKGIWFHLSKRAACGVVTSAR